MVKRNLPIDFNILPEDIINEDIFLTLKEFCDVSQVEEHYIIEMVEMGILEPKGKTIKTWQFPRIELQRLRKAQRLQSDLKLNLPGVALCLDLLDEVSELREYIKHLEHRIKIVSNI